MDASRAVRFNRFWDIDLLLDCRLTISNVQPKEPPRARFAGPAEGQSARRIAILPGSFNPPTTAHLALADSVLLSGRVDAIFFLLATRTVNKERVEGLTLDDRLLLLSLIVEGQPARGWIVVNRGLLVDQAELTYHHLPNLEKLWFVVGYDKIVQIFDKKYYENRDDALQRLFSRASFLVAPRGEDDVSDLEALLDQVDNRQFESGVLPLPLPEQYRGVSSSHVRAEVAQSGTFPDVSDLVAAFVSQIGAYDAPHASDGEVINRYEWREGIVKAVELGRIKKPSSSEFYDLFCRTTADGPEGKSLRDWLVRLISPSVADSAAGSIR